MQQRTFQQRYDTLLTSLSIPLAEGDQEFFRLCETEEILLSHKPKEGNSFFVEIFAQQGGYILAESEDHAINLVGELVRKYSLRSQSGLYECFNRKNNSTSS